MFSIFWKSLSEQDFTDEIEAARTLATLRARIITSPQIVHPLPDQVQLLPEMQVAHRFVDRDADQAADAPARPSPPRRLASTRNTVCGGRG